MANSRSKIIGISVFIFSLFVFFAGFRYDVWNVLKDGKRLDNQAESLVLGRMVKSRTDGIFSSAGLCGRSIENVKDTALFNYQYKAFLEDLSCRQYDPYLSQIGFHAMMYSLIDKVLPFSSETKLQILYSFKSAMLALVMSLVVLWFFLEIGLLPALFVLSGISLTPWFTFLGTDLWFCVWTNFIPFMVSSFLLRNEHLRAKPSGAIILLLTTLAILFNFIYNGFEWVSTTVIMASVPFFYFWQKADWPLNKLLRRIGWLIAGFMASALLTFSVIIYQISLVKGTMSKGIDWIIFSFQKRTYGGEGMPEAVAAQLSHSLRDVFVLNLSGMAFPFPPFISNHLPGLLGGILFAEVVIALIIITFLLFYKSNFLNLSSEKIQTPKNLAIISWISILAPLSWSVIFKGHAWSHYHINYITWFMPFGLFVMALAGATISAMIRRKGNVHTLSVR